jgi:hypothetical protein
MRRNIGGNSQDRRRARRAASRRLATNTLSLADIRDIHDLVFSVVAAASGSTGLPLSDRGVAWDSGAADKAVRAWAGADDAPNAKYGRAFFVKDGDGSNFSDFHLPFATVIDGKLTAVWRGVTAAAAALQGARGASVEGGDAAKPKIAAYYAAARKKYGDESITVPWADSESADESATRLVGGVSGRGGNDHDSSRESAAGTSGGAANGHGRVDVLADGRDRELRPGSAGDDPGLARSGLADGDAENESELAAGISLGLDGADGEGTASTDAAVPGREAAAGASRADHARTPGARGSQHDTDSADGTGADLAGDESAESEGLQVAAYRLAYAEIGSENPPALAERYHYWKTTLGPGAAELDPDWALVIQGEIAEIISVELGGEPSQGTKKDKRLKKNKGGSGDGNDGGTPSNDQPDDNDMAAQPELAALDAVDDFAASVQCACGHAFSEHSGAGGTCDHEDGRGTCRCGEFAYPESEVTALADVIVATRPDLAGFEAEIGQIARRALLALSAAAGDVVWGPEEGLMDLLCDINALLHPNESDTSYWPAAVDVSVGLDKVLICDERDYYVAGLTVGGDGDPVLADRADWVEVEDAGYVETKMERQSKLKFSLTDLTLTADAAEAAIPEVSEVIPERSDEITPPANPAGHEWTATFVPEGVLTEDGRAFAPGSIILPPDEQARQLPLTLMGLIETSAEGGHDRAKVAGRIDAMWRDDGKIKASGVFSDDEWGQKIEALVGEKSLTGLSVDIAPLDWEHVSKADWFNEDGEWIAVQGEDGVWSGASGEDAPPEEDLMDAFFNGDLVLAINRAVIGMATVCPFPAFGQASIDLVAAGGGWVPHRYTGPAEFEIDCGCAETLVEPYYKLQPIPLIVEEPSLTAAAAGLAPVSPPADWFANPEFDEVTPLTITDGGQIFGHAWQWDTCHLSFEQCVTAPHSNTNYAYYLLGEIECDEGEHLAVGKITLDSAHAGTRLSRQDATSHYDNTGTVAAHVSFGEDEHGGWFAGAINPELSEEKLRILRGSTVSGDWRGVDGNLELVALLSVNVPGFPVPRSLRASFEQVDDEPVAVALVAAGIVAPTVEDEIRSLVNEVTEA